MHRPSGFALVLWSLVFCAGGLVVNAAEEPLKSPSRELLGRWDLTALTSPGFLPLLARQLSPHGIALPAGPYQLYRGDRAVPGKGEILVLA